MGKLIIFMWVAAELTTYAVFFAHFSIPAGAAVGAGSIILGVLILRQLGRKLQHSTAADLMETVRAAHLSSLPRMLLAAMLLLLPGFLSNVAGFILAMTGLGALIRSGARKPASRNIELTRDEWTRLPDDEAGR